jgi:ubiquinone/menaquinone biosynthesis C-methylase UbiE
MKPTNMQRRKVVPHATGHVLEIGIGSGLNLPYYSPKAVSRVVGLDPSVEVWNRRDVHMVASLEMGVDFVEGSATAMPFENQKFDSAVVTYALCSIRDLEMVFDEIRRVLKPGGKLLFCEHGKAPDDRIFKWQKRLDPVWGIFSGGCSLQKDIPEIIEANGFQIKELEEMYVPGWRPGSYNYWGRAEPR